MLRSATELLKRTGWTGANQARALMTYVPSPGDGAKKTVTLIPGDGVGPELTQAVEKVVDAMGAPVEWEKFNDVSGKDGESDVPEVVLESIKKNKVCLKGTLFTPLGSDNTSTESTNVKLRKLLDLHINLVHGFSIPGLKTRHEDLDIVVIRENTEGEYSGLEHEVVPGVVESLKVITEAKSLRTARYAFEYAYLNDRRKVTAVHKANIMKLGDGEFLKACRKVASSYPNIQFEEMIVDNTCMQLVSHPEQFDVMVTPNLYGNLVANIVAGLCGGQGVCPGGNVGGMAAIFEQGARYPGRSLSGSGLANPTAFLFSTAMMLRHIKLFKFADRLEDSIVRVYKEENKSILTPDVGGTGNLESFTNAVIKGL
ncbi:hypothetical protein BSKO_08252 [Bryopsis sp. KO-2023]|nr:hypothetical protein BSKO_08252 [Bryopsis sp. KO-2023]